MEMSGRTRVRRRSRLGGSRPLIWTVSLAAALIVSAIVEVEPALAGKDAACDLPGQVTSSSGGWETIKIPEMPREPGVLGGDPIQPSPRWTVDPANPKLLFAWPTQGAPQNLLMRSGDGGCHWETIRPTIDGQEIVIRQVEFAQDEHGKPMVLLISHTMDEQRLGLSDTTTRILRSTDNGVTWAGGGEDDRIAEYTTVEVSPSDPRVVFAMGKAMSWGTSMTTSVWSSTDGGTTWAHHDVDPTQLEAPKENPALCGLVPCPLELPQVPQGNDSRIFFRIDPGDPNSLWMLFGYSGLHRSTDGGRTWRQVEGVPPDDVEGFDLFGKPGVTTTVAVLMRFAEPCNSCGSIRQGRECRDPFGEERDCLYLSKDGGASWARIPLAFSVGVGYLDATFGRRGTVFALGWPLYQDGPRGVFRFEERTGSWVQVWMGGEIPRSLRSTASSKQMNLFFQESDRIHRYTSRRY